MKEITGDIFSSDIVSQYQMIGVLTNGIVKTNGELVMGAGQAKLAATLFPSLPKYLGQYVKQYGNAPYVLQTTFSFPIPDGINGDRKDFERYLVSFPTKEHYRSDSDLELIQRSIHTLVHYVDTIGIQSCVIPRPGCGLGGLDWESQVKPLLEAHLDDRFSVISYN